MKPGAMDSGAGVRPGSIEYWAHKKPGAIVARDESNELTWADLNQKADNLAQALADAGLRPNDIVALRTHVRVEWIVAQAALSKLGCILLGLNWRLTGAEAQFILENAGARAIICDDTAPGELSSSLDAAKVSVRVSIDTSCQGFDDYASLVSTPASPRFSTADVPLIIYTSGTTGRPKGVMIGRPADGPPPDPSVAEYAASVAMAMPRSEQDTVLVTMPLSHGSGPAQIRRALHTGSRIVLRRRYHPEEVLRTIATEKVNSWVVVPTMLNRLAALPEATLRAHDLSSLTTIQVGAAPVSPAIKQWVVDRFGKDILHEGYGSTETGMISHLTPEMYAHKPRSSGRPYRHVEIEVRDGEQRRRPTGAQGEIWVRTPVVIRNYFNAPPLDSDTLDANGFFRTGDVGYVDDEGFLFITDRVKDMIVSGGVNIYPAEVEGAIHEHPAVQDVAVIGVPDPDFGEVGKAFIELKPQAVVDAGQIIAHCKPLLAAYKIPKTVEFIDELPRNSTGKVLKRELRQAHWKDHERQI